MSAPVPSPYSLGPALPDEASGRYRVSVFLETFDGRELVAAGYGDTPLEAEIQGRSAMRTHRAAWEALAKRTHRAAVAWEALTKRTGRAT